MHFSSGGAAAPRYNKSTWVCCCLGTQGSSIFREEIASKGYFTGKQRGRESKPLIILILILRLKEFHRNRVVQIRKSVELNNIYHVKTEALVADVATRPEKEQIKDVLPGSR